MLETINNDFTILSSKYHLSNGLNPQNNQLNEVDELIKKFQNYGSDKTKVVKMNDYKNNLIYLHERLIKMYMKYTDYKKRLIQNVLKLHLIDYMNICLKKS